MSIRNRFTPMNFLKKRLRRCYQILDPHHILFDARTISKSFVSRAPKEAPKKAALQTADLSHSIMYVKLPLFHAKAFDDINDHNTQKILKKIMTGKSTGLCFDLRNNPGGAYLIKLLKLAIYLLIPVFLFQALVVTKINHRKSSMP